MAASFAEGLFSLELLVDWVRLEAGLPPPPVVAVGEEQELEEETPPPRLSPPLCPAVAFRLLDFPTLLVYPPGGPAAPAPEPRPGLLSFGRGKSCLFRLHPATLRRGLLGTPLYTLLLQLHPGRPTPAPQLLGACSISLAAVAHKVLGSAASGCSQGHRGSFPLHNHVGERIGDIALCYRLTDLGSSLLGHLERPVISTGGGVEGVEGWEAVEIASQAPQEKQLQQPDSEPSPRGADRPLVGFKIPKAPKNLKEIVFHSRANSHNLGSVENGKTNSICSNASGVESVRPPSQEVTELDVETNTFCPPPLYYTHLTQEKTPAQRKITIKPLMHAPEELDGAFLEEKLGNTPTYVSPLKHTSSATHESPPVLINPPHVQDVGASNQSTSRPQTEQNRINTIRQLPLLNALLVELSLLNNQPMASPAHIHPHLAWLYRTEDKKSPESSARSTCKSEYKKSKLPMEEKEKSVSLQYKKNQVENLKKGKHFEKNSDPPKRRVPRGKLLYGLTNTLKLRLKQTNPDMLIVHEKREQYRKMQAQMFSAKFRIPSSKAKALSFAEQHQKPRQLPKDKYLESDASSAESDTSKQISVFDELSTTKENKLKCATEETVDSGENRTNNSLLEEMVTPAHSIIPESFTHTNILEGKVEMKVQSPFVFKQVAVVDRIVVDKEMDDKQVRITANDILAADVSENKPSKNSCSESISELKYSDDFTSPSYSEDSYTTEGTSRILQAHDGSPESPKHSQYTSKSSETRLSIRKNNSEKSSILSPPYSAGSPVHSHKKFHISKTQDKSLEEASTTSTSDLSSYWTEEKENQIDQNSVHNSEAIKRGQDISGKLETRTGFKSLEKSQSSRTSQVSSYLPSNLSELELNVLDCSTSDHFGEDSDEVGSLNISKQCKDICELVINKLPGYTV
ncbi:PREDICTED: microtubule-associated protein 10 [Hipposideros armiger]|uniref:Microtubule-associated protein 10 n=1 Tax=Hipposideros armiger TaxID=186990 RepID=A0A8B7QLY5_HIPAR|nr:PREDICTED: microtubule-associated protein 10 [Hipposideros armiger]